MKSSECKNWTTSLDERGVLRLVLNVPGRPVNVLDVSVMQELEDVVSYVEGNDQVRMLVMESGKESGFLAGADVGLIAAIESPSEAAELIQKGQLLFQRIEWLSIPTLAVIHGPCMGGGLELALACDYRLARDNSSTVLGLPEIKLGLIPGWGGTQRLPKTIGLVESLPMILQGKTKNARAALACGLVDKAIAPDDWVDETNCFIDHVREGGFVTKPIYRRSLRRRFVESNPIGRRIILNAASKRIASQAKHFPALQAAIRSIRGGYTHGVNGYELECREFVKLLPTRTCRSLLNLFFAREKARNRLTWSSDQEAAIHASPVQKIGVVGAGTMGSGIAHLSAMRGFDVTVREVDRELVEQGQARIKRLIDQTADHKRWTIGRRNQVREQIEVTCQSQPFSDSDIVIEAIVERMDVKHAVLGELQHQVSEGTILATNTSSLSVDEMAVGLRRPDQFGGLHFFNPVSRMELVEVVRGIQTSDQTVARLVSLVRALGKTPIVTSDSPGFLVNRVLFPYLGEAVMMVAEGYEAAGIDKSLRKFGMPMGPLELLDQVGIDVAFHVANSLAGVMRDADRVAEGLSSMIEQDRLGKKSGQGFYLYQNGKRGQSVTPAMLKNEPVALPDFIDDGLTRMQRRLVYPMLNEAVRCLDEQVVREAWMVDLAMVLGTGFAPHTGGPLHVLDAIGSKTMVTNTRLLQSALGERFSPPRSLRKMVDSGGKFYSGLVQLGPQALEDSNPK